MSDHALLGILIVLVGLLHVYSLIVVRDVHRLTNETLLKVDTTLDLVGERGS